jgi:hypothetical protein
MKSLRWRVVWRGGSRATVDLHESVTGPRLSQTVEVKCERAEGEADGLASTSGTERAQSVTLKGTFSPNRGDGRPHPLAWERAIGVRPNGRQADGRTD